MQRADPVGPAVHEIVLSVPAMTCRDCVRAISGRFRGVPGALAVEADLTKRTGRVQGTPQPDALPSAIADASYEGVEVSHSSAREGSEVASSSETRGGSFS